ncbi:CZB domain-containing protein [Sulfurimonas sp.]|nr:CZB domain-containing protein [Sulfurimonas sp.]
MVFVILAKIDHTIYKSNAYSSIYRREIKNKFDSVTECRLGKWYHTDAKDKFGHTKGYSQVDQPHKRIHSLVDKNIAYISNGDKVVENKEEIIENFKGIERESQNLYAVMEKMINEADSICDIEGDCR